MNKIMSAALLVLTASAAPAWAQDKTYIVRFKDNAVPHVKERSVHDDRLANDEGWAHVGERVMGHVQTLEKRHGVRAEAAFGTVFKGMSARLTPAQRDALQRDPSVDVIEEEQIFSIKPTGQVGTTATVSTQSTPWGISKT